MKSQPLSPETLRRVALLFAPTDHAAAQALLVQECGNNLPLLGKFSMYELERVRFAALKLSNGSLAGLQKAVALANEDWRDLLVSAEFADDIKAHERWLPTGHAG
jgi:hypothetical protein